MEFIVHPKSLSLTLALLIAPLLFPGYALAAEPAGHIDTIKGEVHVLRGSSEVPALPDTIVEVGDNIRTGKASRVRILLNDGSSMQLGQNAEALIERYKIASAGGLMDALINLLEGRGRFIVEKLKRTDAHYRIKTRAVLIGVRGTDILAQASGYTGDVALVEGRIALSRSGYKQQVPLSRGEYIKVAGAWPAKAQPIPEKWLADFINDVGTSDGGKRKKKGGGSGGDDGSAPSDVLQQKTINQMGNPMIVPQ